ncbi:hypothetical protein C8J57DRAFT_1537911 [Mycena rebaudengoi]|nr:hypothetical protein C8J57DRAFT_1537911 [Mycena rebaudengoi]
MILPTCRAVTTVISKLPNPRVHGSGTRVEHGSEIVTRTRTRPNPRVQTRGCTRNPCPSLPCALCHEARGEVRPMRCASGVPRYLCVWRGTADFTARFIARAMDTVEEDEPEDTEKKQKCATPEKEKKAKAAKKGGKAHESNLKAPMEGEDNAARRALKMREWCHKLQRTFSSGRNKWLPKDDEMPAVALFTTVEYQIPHSVYLPASPYLYPTYFNFLEPHKFPRVDEFRFWDCAKAYMEKWHAISNKRGGDIMKAKVKMNLEGADAAAAEEGTSRRAI